MAKNLNPRSRQLLNQRRLRLSPQIRELTREVRVSVEQMMQPYFVVDGIRDREPIPGLTGTFRDTPSTLLRQVEADLHSGVNKMLLFAVPKTKHATQADPRFAAAQIKALRKAFGRDLFIGIDVCLCSSTPHGQCGVLTAEGDHVDNSATVQQLARAALAFAEAGADCVAPSDMMDGRIAAIREALDGAGLDRTLLMSYSAKFHSKFYGPFRVAADSAPKGEVTLKDRATYQIDPACPRDALASSLRDAAEGADILMVKPGMPYLDVLQKLSRKINKPWAVYEVSGEFAAIEVLAEKGLISREAAHVEAWTAFARAGAQIIITYGARYAREWLERCTSTPSPRNRS